MDYLYHIGLTAQVQQQGQGDTRKVGSERGIDCKRCALDLPGGVERNSLGLV